MGWSATNTHKSSSSLRSLLLLAAIVVSYAALAVFKASLAARVCCRLSIAANVTLRKEKHDKNTHHSQLLQLRVGTGCSTTQYFAVVLLLLLAV
jgi:hypothetical protein